MLSFQFVPTKDDYIKAFRAFYLTNWPTWAVIIFVLLFQGLCIASAFIRGDINFEFSYMVPLMIFVFILFYFAYALIINPLKVANGVEKDKILSSPVQYQATDEGLVIVNQFSENKLTWENFQRVIDSKEVFLLIYSTNKNMFQMIPKRAFSSIEDELAFKNLAYQKIPHKKQGFFDSFDSNLKLRLVLVFVVLIFSCAVALYSFI